MKHPSQELQGAATPLRWTLGVLGSSRLALVLVGILIVLGTLGAIAPQAGIATGADIARWKEEHGAVGQVFELFGSFDAFQSWPFLVTVGSLGVNTLACTLVRFMREDGMAGLRLPGVTRRIGFYCVHVAVLLILGGGFWTLGTRLTGYIVLTENQVFEERHDAYLMLSEGKLRAASDEHRGFSLRLVDVETRFDGPHRRIGLDSKVRVERDGETLVEHVIRHNEPLEYEGVQFTQDESGYSPRIAIRPAGRRNVLSSSFVALKTFRVGEARAYRDFLPLPIFTDRVVVSIYPSFEKDGDGYRMTSEQLSEPLMVITRETEDGEILEQVHVPLGEWGRIGNHELGFLELRRWSAFLVGQDPGFDLIWLALWFGLAAMLLRYSGDLSAWFREPPLVPAPVRELEVGGDQHGTQN